MRQSAPISTWRLPIPATMDEYTASLAKKYRHRVRNCLKRFATNTYQVTISQEGPDFLESWDDLISLHQRRRNSLGQPGCFASCQFSEFLMETAKAFQAKGRIELACINFASRRLAIELCFHGESTTFAYQVGIDPDELKRSPGWLVNTAAIQSAIDRGQDSLDWCRGDEEYKRRLGAIPSPSITCRIVPPKLRSQLWDAALVGKSTVKDWVKNGLNAAGIRS